MGRPVKAESCGISRTSFFEGFQDPFDHMFAASEKKRFFHYTSAENCLSMVRPEVGSGRDCYTLFASHLKYLNDESEFREGTELLRDHLDFKAKREGWNDLKRCADAFYGSRSDVDLVGFRRAKDMEEVYVSCFCDSPNLLSQWKYYGGESGVSIEYGLFECEYSGFCHDGERVLDDFCCFHPQRVIYRTKKKNKAVEKGMRKTVEGVRREGTGFEGKARADMMNALARLQLLAPLLKDEAYNEEHESRMLFMPLYCGKATSEDARKLIEYRYSGGRVVPYMEIRLREKAFNEKKNGAIRSITVGPGRNQQVIFEGLKHYLMSAFSDEIYRNRVTDSAERDTSDGCVGIVVKGIELRRSKTPFRW